MQSLTNTPRIPTPISILHEDILWRIFMENVDFPEDITVWRPTYTRPLITARHCSQVCQQWRNIFLSSSSIWAKMIDVDSLEQKTDKWWEEVVSRTGQAPLWIYGRVQLGMVDFIGQFLKNNWPRIQAIGICELSSHILSVKEHQEIWACLRQPAPNLRKLDIFISDMSGRTVLLDPLFADNAPILKELQIASFTYKFERTASWVRNLSAVTFFRTFSLDEVLEALRHMPQLAHLKVIMEKMEETSVLMVETSPTNMPRLKMVQLDADIRRTTAVLNSITPSPDCCLSVNLDYSSFHAGEYEKYERASMKYFGPYFSLHRPSALRVQTQFGSSVIMADGAPTDGRRFCIPISQDHVPHLVDSSITLKELIKAGCLADVKELELHDRSSSSGPTFARLSAMSIFSSITRLTTIDGTLDWLLEKAFLRSLRDEFLPNLASLKVVPDKMEWVLLFPKNRYPAYHRFLKHRKAIGLPISVLEIHLDALENVDYLDEHTGLVVRSFYRHQYLGEYRCGDGHPERLRFGTMKKR